MTTNCNCKYTTIPNIERVISKLAPDILLVVLRNRPPAGDNGETGKPIVGKIVHPTGNPLDTDKFEPLLGDTVVFPDKFPKVVDDTNGRLYCFLPVDALLAIIK
jgi:hypothetical protein